MANPGDYIEIVSGRVTHHVKKDYNLYSGGDLTINAGKSVTLSAEGGINFGDYEEPPKPEARRKNSGSEKPILQLEWINEAGEKTKGLLYGEKATILVSLTKSIKGKTLEFLFREKASGKELKKASCAVKNDSLTQKYSINFTIEDFVACGRHQGQYIFELTFEGEVYINSSEILQVFPVIYIPEVMKSMGWTYSFKSQQDWFRGDPIEFPWQSQPRLEDFHMGWAMKFERIKRDYDDNINKWKSDNAINLLRKRIKKDMIDDGYASLPTQLGEIKSFGTFSTKIIQELRVHNEVKPSGQAMEFMPTYEKYYFQDISIQGGWLEKMFTTFDDFFGSIASCNIRFIAKGTLERKKHGIEATIVDLGIYLRDGFDYVGEQFLGYWSFKDKKVSSTSAENYIRISNDSYNSYRNVLRKGSDFYRYSNIYVLHPNYKFML